MRFLLILPLALIFQVSSGQTENERDFKNTIEIGATANIIPGFNTLVFNGWGDNKYHGSIIAYTYKREICSVLYLGVNFSYLWSNPQNIRDPEILPVQTNLIGKNFTIEFGRKFNNVLPMFDISAALNLGLQTVTEKSLIYRKPDFDHIYFENVGDRGLLVGLSVAGDFNLSKRVSVGLSSSLYHRLGFRELENYYTMTDRVFHQNFILVQPKVGFHF